MSITATQKTLIIRAYASLPNLPLGGYRDAKLELLAAFLDTERIHRRGRPPPAVFSVVLAAKYHTVHWLIMAVRSTIGLQVKAYLHTRSDIFLAYAISEEFRPALDAWLIQADWVTDFEALDYVELMA